MNIQFERLAVIGQLTIDSLNNNLNGAEIGFIAGKIYLIEKGSEVKFTKGEIVDILTVFKMVSFEGIGSVDVHQIDAHLLMAGFLLDVWLSEFQKVNEKVSYILGGNNE